MSPEPSPQSKTWTRTSLQSDHVTWAGYLLFIGLFSYLILRYMVWKQPVLKVSFFEGHQSTLFGPLIVSGIIFGTSRGKAWCAAHGLSFRNWSGWIFPIAISSLVFAHFSSVFMYHFDSLSFQKLFDLRVGFSSFGGFLFATVATFILFKVKKIPIIATFDAVFYGLLAGWLFGRLGCFSVHDHPGPLNDGFFGVDIAGEMRIDLGFLELLYTIVVYAWITWGPLPNRAGGSLAIICLTYAPIRFGLDFMRAFDAQYVGLTPAQWFCPPLFLIGLWLLLRPIPKVEELANG